MVFGAEAARGQYLFLFFAGHFSYTLLPLPGKTTRPGVLDRNYDLDARCVVCAPPPRNPGRPTNHHAPCSLPCCIARASSQCTRGEYDCRPARCRSGRHHSVARIWLTLPACLACSCFVLCPATRCHCRVWELMMDRNVAMPSADCLGKESEDEAAGSDESFAACRLPTASRMPGRSGILLYSRRQRI